VTTNELGTTIASSVDALRTVVSAATVQAPSTANRVNETVGFSELQGAVEALTAALERLTTVPDIIEEPPPGGDQASRSKIQQPHLARELRQLLQDIETPR
jgi:hypothetical protein